MTMTRPATILIVIIMLFTFPVWIGLAGGMIGLFFGLLGGMIGIIAGIFGAIIGVIAWIFKSIFGLFFGWPHWDCDIDFHPSHFNHYFLAAIVVVVLAVIVSKRKS
jgi:hypothetical protein